VRARATIHSDRGIARTRLEDGMTDREHKLLMRGVAAGMIMGVAIGLLLALFIAMKPAFFAALAG